MLKVQAICKYLSSASVDWALITTKAMMILHSVVHTNEIYENKLWY